MFFTVFLSIRGAKYELFFDMLLTGILYCGVRLAGVSLSFCAGGQWGFSAGHF